MNKLFYLSFALCLIIGCSDKKSSDQKKVYPTKKTSTPTTTSNDSLTETQDYIETPKSDILVYDLTPFYTEKDSLLLISLSDDYQLSEHKDSLAIPDIKNLEESAAQYLQLNSKYKNRMLSKMKIAETDSVFVYDYATNALKTFAVKDLKAVAHINIYGADWPYSQFDYMIGFEIDKNALEVSDRYYSNTVVCIGKTNPFAMKKLQAVKWKETASVNIPSVPVDPKYKSFMKGTTKKKSYTYTSGDLQYFLQDYAEKGDVTGRRLLVENKTTHKIVFENYHYNDEGGSLTPLNFNNPDNEIYQWSGKLFKNKPDVIFGFEYASFGCNAISFISKTEPPIYRSCDNRH